MNFFRFTLRFKQKKVQPPTKVRNRFSHIETVFFLFLKKVYFKKFKKLKPYLGRSQTRKFIFETETSIATQESEQQDLDKN